MKAPGSFAEREERKRKLLSVGLTLGIYVVGLGTGIVVGILRPNELVYSNTTVLLNLAGPESTQLGLGSVNPSETGEETLTTEAPAPAKAVSEAAKVDVPKTASPAKPVENTSPETKAAQAAAPKPAAPSLPDTVPVAAAPGAASEPAAVEQPSTPEAPYVPGPRGPGSRVSSSNSSVLVPGQGSVPVKNGNVNVFNKSELGYSHEISLGGAEGAVRPNIWAPIMDYLPLPKEISEEVYNAIPSKVQPPNTVIYSAQFRKDTFLKFYEKSNNKYIWKYDAPLEVRSGLWEILRDAGYEINNSDYFKDKKLTPLVIGFTISKDYKIKGIEILQSSGDVEIDRAVRFAYEVGFQFSNKSGESVQGRSIIRF